MIKYILRKKFRKETHNMSNITNDIRYIGVNDHDIDLFEGMYTVPEGMAYNSYVILDDRIAVMGTTDCHYVSEWLTNKISRWGDHYVFVTTNPA